MLGFLFKFEIVNNVDMIYLFEEIKKGKNRFENEIFHPIYESSRFESILYELKRLDFINCEFNGFELEDLSQPNLTVFFKECIFNGQLLFSDVHLNGLLFIELKKITTIDLSGKFTRIRFNNQTTSLVGDIQIEAEIIQELNFENFNQKDGIVELTINNSSLDKKDEFRTFFKKSKFNNLVISETNFGYITNFTSATVLKRMSFLCCTFEKCSFDNSNLLGEINFFDCIFNGLASFKNFKGDELANFYITKSKFTKSVDFNRSSLNKLTLNDTVFNELTFFQETRFNSISIDRTIFEKGAFFDDIHIIKIDSCNRRSIRTIKQELQKTENRIDFNRFKNYEMATYYRELNWKESFVDKSILFMTKISTDFGSNWIKAFWFTIFSGIGFYLLFYAIENQFHTIDISNWDSWTRLISGLFRFFLVTDFYNPLETDRVYLTNPLSWLVFIFGKIVIAFGIYEMIQSFRKFKA